MVILSCAGKKSLEQGVFLSRVQAGAGGDDADEQIDVRGIMVSGRVYVLTMTQELWPAGRLGFLNDWYAGKSSIMSSSHSAQRVLFSGFALTSME